MDRRSFGELFPGLLEELVAEGAPVWADGDLSKLDVTFGGHRLVRTGRLRDPIPSAQYYPSRALLEHQVRQRLRAMANVTILDGHDVVQLVTTTDRKRVTGVCVVNRNGGCATVLTADLVVDATGRGSRTPAFLEALGYGRPTEDELVIGLA